MALTFSVLVSCLRLFLSCFSFLSLSFSLLLLYLFLFLSCFSGLSLSLSLCLCWFLISVFFSPVTVYCRYLSKARLSCFPGVTTAVRSPTQVAAAAGAIPCRSSTTPGVAATTIHTRPAMATTRTGPVPAHPSSLSTAASPPWSPAHRSSTLHRM